VTARNNMDDLKKELASLRLDHEPARARRGAWVVIAVLVFMVAAGTIFWWGGGVRRLRPVASSNSPALPTTRPCKWPKSSPELSANLSNSPR